jgi:hypothetical protein
MLDNFKRWYTTYNIEITWFLIGWCTLAGIYDLGRGDIAGAGISFGIAFLNYSLRNR